MAYGNWGAFVWKNGEFRKDCCDTGFDTGDLHIGGHAVIDCGDLVFEFYKSYFPTIFEKKPDGTYKKWGEDEFIRSYGLSYVQDCVKVNMRHLSEDKKEPDIDDFYFSFNRRSVVTLAYNGCHIVFIGDIFDLDIPINTVKIITPNGDVWYCAYGMSFGNGFDKEAVSKCHNKYMRYDEDQKEYRYFRGLNRKMKKACSKDNRRNQLYWIRCYTKDFLKSMIRLNFVDMAYYFRIIQDYIYRM